MSQDRAPTSSSPLREARALIADCRTLSVAQAPDRITDGALYHAGLADRYSTTDSPLGLFYMAWSEAGLTFAQRAPDDESFKERARAETGRPVTRSEAPERIARGARAWLEGAREDDLLFDLRQLTPFERAVLMKARDIPRGEVRPYGWIAREIGHPGAVRAVGTALARNPIPLFIPCHRVVRSDGHLGAYSMGGLGAKRAVLTYEGVDVDGVERLASSGVRYIGHLNGRYYCYPTCANIMSLPPEKRTGFHNEASALAKGFHPCGTCRPPAARRAS
jgi:O-6-methylguanine DNA methyltransferase